MMTSFVPADRPAGVYRAHAYIYADVYRRTLKVHINELNVMERTFEREHYNPGVASPMNRNSLLQSTACMHGCTS